MKKLFIYATLLAAVFTACDPVESRDVMTGAITVDQLQITATPVVVNGKNSNKVILENNSPILSLWDYGLGTSAKAYVEVLLVLTGENTIKFTGLNADGTYITKDLAVQVDELTFEVPKEWALFCGDGERTWTWDPDAHANVFANGGRTDGGSWWGFSLGSIDTPGEGAGAEMIFSTAGATLTKVRNNGTTAKGTFAFDMSAPEKAEDGSLYTLGVLKTKGVTVLHGISFDKGQTPLYVYDIAKLTNEQMVLQCMEDKEFPWNSCWYWYFKSK